MMESTIKVIGQKVDDLLDTVSCPISTFPFKDPVITADGYTYERIEIEEWLKKSQDSPYTNERLANKTLMPNKVIKIMSSSLIELKDHIAEQEVKLKAPRLEFMNIRDWLDFIGVKDKEKVDETLKVLASQQIHQTIDVIRRDFEVRSMWLEVGLDRDILEVIIIERRKLASYFANSKSVALENEKKLEMLQSKFDKSLQLATEVIDKYSKMYGQLQNDPVNNSSSSSNSSRNSSRNNEKSSSFTNNLSKGGRNSSSNPFITSSHALSSTPAVPASALASKEFVASGVGVTKIINSFEGGGGGAEERSFKFHQQPIKQPSFASNRDSSNSNSSSIHGFHLDNSNGFKGNSSSFSSTVKDTNDISGVEGLSGGGGVGAGLFQQKLQQNRQTVAFSNTNIANISAKNNVLTNSNTQFQGENRFGSTSSSSIVISAKKVCCPRDHILVLCNQYINWFCDASNEPGGCKRGVSNGGSTGGVPRFRCDHCDLDYCGPCYESKDNLLNPKVSEARSSFELSSPTIFNPVSLFSKTVTSNIASPAFASNAPLSTSTATTTVASKVVEKKADSAALFVFGSKKDNSFTSSFSKIPATKEGVVASSAGHSFNSNSNNNCNINSNSNSNSFASSKPTATQWFKHPEPSATQGKLLVKTSITKSSDGAFGLTFNKIKFGVRAGGVIIQDPLEGPALLCNPSLRAGDVIIGINGSSIRDYDLFMNAIKKMSSSNPKVEFLIERERDVHGEGVEESS